MTLTCFFLSRKTNLTFHTSVFFNLKLVFSTFKKNSKCIFKNSDLVTHRINNSFCIAETLFLSNICRFKLKMPIDHKRINGPDESVPYQLFTRLNLTSAEQKLNEALKNGVRADSRKVSEHRKLFLKTGVISQAKGSAYIEQGKTKVIVSVFDPREIPNRPDYSLKGEIYCEFKFAPFSCPKRRLHQQDSEEKEYSCIMKKALESAVCLHELPNFQVDIYALVLNNNGSALSAAITASGLALAQAGVPMYDIITSVTMGIQKDIFIDPTLSEEELCQVQMTTKDGDNESSPNHGIVIMSKLHTQEQICQFYHTGYITLEELSSSIEVLSKQCNSIVPLVQKCLVKCVLKDLSNKDSN